MSDFALSHGQRRRLLEGHYGELKFDAAYPAGCKVGARYVLAWKRASATVLDTDTGEFAVTPAHPVWFLTVTKMTRRRQGGWLVRFEITDRRDTDLWLSRTGDYQTSPVGAVDPLPVAPSDEVRAKAREEFDHLRRLQRLAEEQRRRGRERSKARRKRAA